ncbi:hypothetical protein GF327_06965 [Candidatus Woesearchaeota archaeon]|nr:hypothetical protein [Candidatus Woesearchaeota archaeon]
MVNAHFIREPDQNLVLLKSTEELARIFFEYNIIDAYCTVSGINGDMENGLKIYHLLNSFYDDPDEKITQGFPWYGNVIIPFINRFFNQKDREKLNTIVSLVKDDQFRERVGDTYNTTIQQVLEGFTNYLRLEHGYRLRFMKAGEEIQIAWEKNIGPIDLSLQVTKTQQLETGCSGPNYIN